ncbi:MAG: hypothetical protein HQM12_11875 [SAR324 cluster bacterium]|nr:hypothetical protein [SAR324 cluster bacterium]
MLLKSPATRWSSTYPKDIELVVSQVEELRTGCLLAYAVIRGDEAEHLAVAMEICQELLKGKDVFQKYVLPAIDKKVVDLVGHHFQIHPVERVYLQPGTITKTPVEKSNINTIVKPLSSLNLKA